jgi:hypothetical protein
MGHPGRRGFAIVRVPSPIVRWEADDGDGEPISCMLEFAFPSASSSVASSSWHPEELRSNADEVHGRHFLRCVSASGLVDVGVVGAGQGRVAGGRAAPDYLTLRSRRRSRRRAGRRTQTDLLRAAPPGFRCGDPRAVGGQGGRDGPAVRGAAGGRVGGCGAAAAVRGRSGGAGWARSPLARVRRVARLGVAGAADPGGFGDPGGSSSGPGAG